MATPRKPTPRKAAQTEYLNKNLAKAKELEDGEIHTWVMDVHGKLMDSDVRKFFAENGFHFQRFDPNRVGVSRIVDIAPIQ